MGWYRLDGSVVQDQQSLEEGLVEHAPGDGCGPLVRRAGVFQELKRFFQGSSDVAGIMGSGLGPFGDLSPFAADADLLGSQHFFVDEIAVAELQEALLFLFEGFQPTDGSFGFPLGGF